MPNPIAPQQDYEMRRWLKKHKKESNLIFSDSMLRHLHNYFESLDENGDGSIEPEELEDPLMLFGLCQRREEVDQVLRLIDLDGSGTIEFEEFLEVFRQARSPKGKSKKNIVRFKNFAAALSNMETDLQKGVSTRLGLSLYRRKHILNALMASQQRDKTQGMEILRVFEQQIGLDVSKLNSRTAQQVQ